MLTTRGRRAQGITTWSRWTSLLFAGALIAADLDRSPEEISALVVAGQLDEAVARAAESIRRTETGEVPVTMELAHALDEITDAAWRAHPPKEGARPVAEAAVRLKEMLVGPEDPEVAESRHRLGNLLRVLGQPDLARLEYERALAIRESAFGPEALELAPTLNNLGSLVQNLGDHTAARRYLERCLTIREQHAAPESELSPILLNLGRLLLDLNEYEAAEVYLQRSLSIRERIDGPASEAVAKALNAVANVDQSLGRYELAEQRYGRALAIFRGLPTDSAGMVAATLGNLAVLRQAVGDFAEAREMQEEALRYRERNAQREPEHLALALNNMGSLLWHTGDLEEAHTYLEQALGVWRELRPEGDPDTARTLNNLAAVASESGDDETARRHATEALAMVERSVGELHEEAATAVNNLAVFALRRGDLEEARRLQECSLAIYEHLVGAEHPYIAAALVNLGDVLSRMGRHDEAKADLARAVALRERFDGGGFPLASALATQARVLLRAGDADAALGAALGAEARAREQFVSAARSLSERHALGLVAGRPDGLSAALSAASMNVAPAGLRRVHDAVIRSRALVLEEMLVRRQSAHERHDLQTASLQEDLSEKNRRLTQLLLRGPEADRPEPHAELVERARRETEAAERALAARSARYRTEQAARTAGFAEIRAALPGQAALVSYVLWHAEDSKRYSAFVLRPGASNPVLVDLGPANEIDGAIVRWHRAVSAAEDEASYRELAAELRGAIWDPVTAVLGNARDVFVVPEGLLHLVNLDVLPGDGGRYLVETDLRVHLLSVERELVRPLVSRPATRNLLALGAPDFNADPRLVASSRPQQSPDGTALHGVPVEAVVFRSSDPEAPDFGEARFVPLRSAREEVEEIAAMWGEGFVSKRVGDEAGEGRFKLDAAGYRALHVATHAFFLKGNCVTVANHPASRAPLAQVPCVAGTNPLLVSGLALAGANRRSELDIGGQVDDGMLTSAEIASLDLRGVESAVLSACDTGGGDILPGEGVLGLRRAFLGAGVRSVVMSVWRVQDEFASRWMKRFYAARLDEHGSTANAVRAASRAMLESLRRDGRSTHPFYWGAFVAVGE